MNQLLTHIPNDFANLPSEILYGGTFDPPHKGHFTTIAMLQTKFPNIPIRILPCHTPNSEAGPKIPHASFKDRLRMVELGAEELFSEGILKNPALITVSDVEAKLEKPNYTVSTVEHLKSKNLSCNYFMVIGQDQLQSLHAWHRIIDLLSSCHFIVVRRTYENEGLNRSSLRQDLISFAQKTGLTPVERTPTHFKFDSSNTHFILIEESPGPGKSEDIRSLLADDQTEEKSHQPCESDSENPPRLSPKNKSANTEMTPKKASHNRPETAEKTPQTALTALRYLLPSTEKYIAEHGLYRTLRILKESKHHLRETTTGDKL